MTYIQVNELSKQLGDQVELEDADGNSELFTIVAELSINGNHYCALKHEKDKKDDEEYYFKVEANEEGFNIVPIDDEDEWEDVSEAFDEWFHDHQAN